MPRPEPNRNSPYKRCAISATSCGHNSTRCISPTLSRDGRHRAHFASKRKNRRRPDMPPPEDSRQPRLAAGCRWGGTEENRVILFPEGAIKLQGTGRQVLEDRDGQRPIDTSVAALHSMLSQ